MITTMFNQDENQNKITARWRKVNGKATSKIVKRATLEPLKQAQFDAFIELTYYAMNANVSANPFLIAIEGMIPYVNYEIIQVAIAEITEERQTIINNFVTNVLGITEGM